VGLEFALQIEPQMASDFLIGRRHLHAFGDGICTKKHPEMKRGIEIFEMCTSAEVRIAEAE